MPAPDERTNAIGAPPRSGSSRAAPTVLLLIAGALLAARIGTAVYERHHPPSLPDAVEWRSIAEGEAEARRSHRPILYDFSAEWCMPCRIMQREVFADRAVARTIGGTYVPVRVLDRAREEGRNPPGVDSLQTRYHVTGFPTLVIVPAGGGEPKVQVGYPGKAETVKWLTRSVFRFTVSPRGHAPLGAEDSTAAPGR